MARKKGCSPRKKLEEKEPEPEVITDAKGVVFDERIHAVDKLGNPLFTRFKTFKHKESRK